MIQKVFSVYDAAVAAFLPPLMLRTRGEAIRSVTEALRDPSHQFTKHASDYTLFELGEWDDNSGKYHLHETPVSLGLLVEFKSQDLNS